MRALVLVACLCAATRTYAATVAVLPFHDLSGGRGAAGEAIRETVTTDLKEVAGLTVIERSAIDKVIAEQHLQAKKTELDPIGSVRVGTLLGATMIVTGAYQRVAERVRLTARFVKVETGEILGAAKVDGAQADFLSLQDRVTVELLRSAGIAGAQAQRFVARQRPKVKSMKTLELYGDAVVELDEQKREALLQAAVQLDPGFVYAARDLDALQARMRGYATVSRRVQDEAMAEQLALIDKQLAAESSPALVYAFFGRLFGALRTEGRPRTLIAVAKKALARAPSPTPTGWPTLQDTAQLTIFSAYQLLMDDDSALREGEKYLAQFPGSQSFQVVKQQMQTSIDRKRERDEGAKKVAQQLARRSAKDRANPCVVAMLYANEHQDREAVSAANACAARTELSAHDRGSALVTVFRSSWALGKFSDARRALEALDKVDPAQSRSWRQSAESFPREE